MNWETFDSLNPELQQEYLFRFKDKPKLNGGGFVWGATALISAVVTLLMITFVMIKDDAFITVRLQLADIVTNTQTVIKFAIPILIGYIITDLVKVGWYYFTEYWWRKKWQIKKVSSNFWKRG